MYFYSFINLSINYSYISFIAFIPTEWGYVLGYIPFNSFIPTEWWYVLVVENLQKGWCPSNFLISTRRHKSPANSSNRSSTTSQIEHPESGHDRSERALALSCKETKKSEKGFDYIIDPS